jgi:hypothetical protein
MATKATFLNVFNIATALYLLETGKDYADITNDHVAIVAYDGTVWACTLDGVELSKAKMVQRIV